MVADAKQIPFIDQLNNLEELKLMKKEAKYHPVKEEERRPKKTKNLARTEGKWWKIKKISCSLKIKNKKFFKVKWGSSWIEETNIQAPELIQKFENNCRHKQSRVKTEKAKSQAQK